MGRTLERVMALTWEEFQRTLPAAAGDKPFRLGPRQATIELAGGERVQITLGATAQRRIASIVLPATPLTIEHHGSDDAGFAAFLARFDRYFQRGGG